MKRFIRNISFFLLIPILYFGGNSLFNTWQFKNQKIRIPQTSIIIAGDSHTKRGVNPAVFDSAQNISQVSEPYVLTFWKLKKVFNSYTPDTLILGFSPHNISAFNDYKFSNPRWSSELFKRSYAIEQFRSIDSKIEVDYKAYYKTLLKRIAFYPKKDHTEYIGSYINSTKSRPVNWKTAIKRHFFLDNKELGYSEISKDYLDSIIQLCAIKEVVPVLINSPLHKNYLNNIPEGIMTEYTSLKKRYEKRAIVLDLSNSAYNDSLFYDTDHLNSYGALKFSDELKKRLSKKSK